MMRKPSAVVGIILMASLAHAGGVDPREMAAEKPVRQEKVTASPEQTRAAVKDARKVITPKVEESVAEEKIRTQRPKGVVPPKVVVTPSSTSVIKKPVAQKTNSAKGQSAWMLKNADGSCTHLSDVAGKYKIGRFSTPKQFAHQMLQRGYQSFALDIGDVPGEVVRVKVPERKVDINFVKSEMCR